MKEGNIDEEIEIANQNQLIDVPIFRSKKVVGYQIQIFFWEGNGVITFANKTLQQNAVELVPLAVRMLSEFLHFCSLHLTKALNISAVFQVNQLAHKTNLVRVLKTREGIHKFLDFNMDIFQGCQKF